MLIQLRSFSADIQHTDITTTPYFSPTCSCLVWAVVALSLRSVLPFCFISNGRDIRRRHIRGLKERDSAIQTYAWFRTLVGILFADGTFILCSPSDMK